VSPTNPYGGLIYFYGVSSSILGIENTTVTDLVVSTLTNGGVAFVAAGVVAIRKSIFTNFTQGMSGGAFHFQYYDGSISDVLIVYCTFTGISALEDGGAVKFGSNSTFVVNGTSFVDCSSGGHGGAFSSSSTKTGSRMIVNCVFGQNSALSNIGMDIYDSSNRSRTYYNSSSLWGLVSTSAHSPEVILFAGTQV
jgi:hypothetical protein